MITENPGGGIPSANEYCPYCMSRVQPGETCPVCGLTQGAYTPAPYHVPPGTILMGRYLIGRVLGEGGFGITYIGCDLRLDMKVAIKEYFPTDRASRHSATSLEVHSFVGKNAQSYERGLQRFLYEARTMARMEKQPQIVMVRDFFEANNTAYIVMEYVEGTNFIDLAKQRGGRIPADELFRLIEPLFTALSAMHKAGLIHRDISPDNLMLEHGSVRLLDFGCARESSSGTETMTVALKQGYAPIEQYQRKGQGPWTDVYALSATIYFCLTGRVPPQSLDRLLSDELVTPRKLGVDITPGQQRALLKGMAVNPEKRFQSVEELHAGLYHPDDIGFFYPPEGGGDDIETDDDVVVNDVVVSDGGKDDNGTVSVVTHDIKAKDTTGKRRTLPGWIMAGAAALLLVIAVIIAVSGGRQDAQTPADATGTGTAGPSAAAAVPERDELFADAATVRTETELIFALADHSIPAVIVAPHSGDVIFSQPVTELTKPLLISEDTYINIPCALVLREGGVLWVAGEVLGEGTIIADGGALVTEGEAYVDSSVYLLTDNSLAQNGGSINGEIHDIRLDDAGARTVSTFDGLRAASQSAGVSAIVVDGSIELTETLDFSAPLIVSEGASISSGAGHELHMYGASLINYGSISSAVWCGGESSAVLNYGTFEPAGGLWINNDGEDDTPWSLLNFGEMKFTAYNAVWSDVLNFGSMVFDATPEGAEQNLLGFDWYGFVNCGDIDIGENAYFYMGGEMSNLGSISVAGNLDIAGLVVNQGRIDVPSGGLLYNYGVLDMYDGGTLNIAEGGEFNTTEGVFLRRDYAETSGAVNGTEWCADFTPIDGEVPQAYAATEAELTEAMADESIEAVVIENELSLTQPLTVTKPLYVAGGLIMPEGAQITVDGTIFCVNGELVCDNLTVQNGGMAELTCSWRGTGGLADLTVTGGSWVYTRDSSFEMRGVVLDEGSMLLWDVNNGVPLTSASVSGGSVLALAGEDMFSAALELDVSGSRVIQLCGMDLMGAAVIEVDGGAAYRQSGELQLSEGAEIIIGAAGSLYNGGGCLTIARGAELLNSGDIINTYFSDFDGLSVEGTLTNSGALYMVQSIRVSGLLDNHGSIYSGLDASEAVIVEPGGAFEGNTSVNPWN